MVKLRKYRFGVFFCLLVIIQLVVFDQIESVDFAEQNHIGQGTGIFSMNDVTNSTQYISNGTWGNNRSSLCRDTAVDNSGYLYTVGENYLRGSPTDPHPDTLLIKWGPDAIPKWDFLLENTNGYSLVVDSSSLYVAGIRYNIEGSTAYIAKWTQSGDFLWEINWSWLEWDAGSAIDIAPDGSIYAICRSYDLDASIDIIYSLLKFNDDGNLLWNRTVSRSGHSAYNHCGVYALSNHEIYVVVDEAITTYTSQGIETHRYEGDFITSDAEPGGALYTISPAEAPDNNSRACIVKRWNYPIWDTSLVVDLQATTLPVFYYTGWFGTVDAGPDGAPYIVFPFKNNVTGPILFKYDVYGNLLWQTSLILPEHYGLDAIFELEVSRNGTIFAVGYTFFSDTGRVSIAVATYEIGTLVPLTEGIDWQTLILYTSVGMMVLVSLTVGGYFYRKKMHSRD